MNILVKKALAFLGVTTIVGMGMIDSLPMEAEEANAAPLPNPYAVSTLEKTYDGTGFVDGKPSPSSTFINSENGYYPGDNNENDGVVSSNDLVGYEWDLKVAAGPERIATVSLKLPDYLKYETKYNLSPCVSSRGITGVFNNDVNNPTCTYNVGRGQSFSATTLITLTGKDTAGTVKENQVLVTNTSVSGEQPYQSDSADPVTVVSAPAADLLIRPDSCTQGGSCSAVELTDTARSFVIFPEVIRYQGYNNVKGATDQTPWTADLDVFGMPEGTTYSINGVNVTPTSGTIIPLPSTVGELTVDFVVPGDWGGTELEEGESADFPVHLIVPKTAFQTDDYLNNGTGWEPGQGNDSGITTFNERDSAARRGYYYPNNDWTMFRVYKPMTPPPGEIFNKTILRSYSGSHTWWEDPNMILGAANNVEFGNKGSINYRKVTEETQIISRLNAYPSNNSDVVPDPGVNMIMGDTWDPSELQIFKNPQLFDENGNVVTKYNYKIQWSPTVVDSESVYSWSDSGWFDSNPLSNPASVKSVRVKIENVPLGAGGPTKLYLDIPQLVQGFDQASPPASFPDIMSASLINVLEDNHVLDYGVVDNFVTPIGTPITKVGLTGTVSPTIITDRNSPVVEYTYTPTVTGIKSTNDLINGEANFILPSCITDIKLTSSAWEIVDLQLGTGCMSSNEVPGSMKVKLKDPWKLGNNYNLSRDMATVSPITFTGTASDIVVGPFSVIGEWGITKINDVDNTTILGSESVTLLVNATDFALTEPRLSTSTPKVEVEEILKFSTSIGAKALGDRSKEAEAILILPGKGADANFLGF